MQQILFKSICAISLVLILSHLSIAGSKPVSITVLYDNYAEKHEMQKDFGFACLIEGSEHNILFDTGRAKDVLFENLNKLNLQVDDIRQIVISHNHTDHTGNLFNVLALNNKATVFLPASVPQPFVEKITPASDSRVVRVEGPLKLGADTFLTGEIRSTGIREQSLVVITEEGGVLVVGCSHPVIAKIVAQAKKLINQDIYMVLGGFHMASFPEEKTQQVIEQLRELGVKKIAPTHCSGEQTRQLFKNGFGEGFMEIGVGSKIRL